MKKNILILLASAIIFIVCSLGLYFLNTEPGAHFDLDSSGYDSIGKHFAEANQLINPANGSVIPVQALGYPFFLGIIYKLFGYNLIWVIFFQVLLSLCSIFLLYRIAIMLFGQDVALITVLMSSCNLGFLIYSQFILTEIFLATLLIAAFERLVNYFKNFNTIALGQAGLLYGLSVAVKPVAMFYAILLFIFISLYALLHQKKLVIQSVCLFVFCFYLPVFGYMLHNKIKFNTFVVAPLLNENIYYYFLAKLIAHERGITWHEGLKVIDKTFEGKDHNDSSRWDNAKNIFNVFVKKKPIFVLRLWLFNVMKTFGGLYTSQLKFLINPSLKGTETSFFSHKGSSNINRFKFYLMHGTNNKMIHIIAFLHLFFALCQYFLVIFALIKLWIDRRYFFVVFLLSSFAYFSLITGHDGCARYRMMIEYFLILLAAFALEEIYLLIKSKKRLIPNSVNF